MSIGSCSMFIVLNRIEASYSWPMKNLRSYHEGIRCLNACYIMKYDHLKKCLNNGLTQPGDIIRLALFYSPSVSECRL
jgi:hypothetical protein